MNSAKQRIWIGEMVDEQNPAPFAHLRVPKGWKLVPEDPTDSGSTMGEAYLAGYEDGLKEAHDSPSQEAARYIWLRAHFEDVFAVNDDGDLVVQVKAIGSPDEDGAKLDAAIDAALATTEGQP